MKFIDLQKQYKKIEIPLKKNLIKTLESGNYIMGEEVKSIEKKLSIYSGTNYAISCANGTDAITLSLMALGLKKDDVVFVPSFTYISTAEAVAQLGGIPFFVDINKKDYNICLDSLEESIKFAKKKKYKIKSIIAVDLFGYPSDRFKLNKIAKKYNLNLIIDAAQSFGCKYYNHPFGLFADIVTTSFFPSKPLGCYGDGGAIFTNNKKIFNTISSLRVHGSGKNKYDNVLVGLNSRLDSIQATILLQKLKLFNNEIVKKNKIANYYQQEISDFFIKPTYDERHSSAWALYTLRTKYRKKFINYLNKNKIPSFIYYAKPLHEQVAYKSFPKLAEGCQNAIELCKEVVSIPIHAYLKSSDINRIIKVVNNFENEH